MIKNAIFVGTVIGIAFGVPMFYLKTTEFNENVRPSAQSQQIAITGKAAETVTKAPALVGAAVAIPMGNAGHFQADFKLNGRKVPAMIDTGATYIAINRSTAARIGIKIAAKDMKYKISTANGQAAAAPAIIRDVAIGKIRIFDVQAVVMEDSALDGVLIGMSFLKELKTFAVENQTLVLKQ
jgi:aspartyl protease family protein